MLQPPPIELAKRLREALFDSPRQMTTPDTLIRVLAEMAYMTPDLRTDLAKWLLSDTAFDVRLR